MSLASTAPDASSYPLDFERVNAFARHTSWLHMPMMAYADYGVVVFALLLVAGWWTSRRKGPRQTAAALWAGAATLVAVALNQPLVARVHEARPYWREPSVLVLVHRSTDFSFPSDHAVMAGAAAAGLWLVSARLGAVASAAALLMAADRVYVGAHYPRDVLAGLAFGAAVALGGWLLLRYPLTGVVSRLAGGPLSALVQSPPPVPDRAGSPA